MASPKFKFSFVVLDDDRMDESAVVLVTFDWFENDVWLTILRFVAINHVPSLISMIEGVGEWRLAKLAFESFPGLSGCTALFLVHNFGSHPTFQAFEMNETDRSCTFTRTNFRVVVLLFSAPAKLTSCLLKFLSVKSRERLYVIILTISVVFKSLSLGGILLHSEFDSTQF